MVMEHAVAAAIVDTFVFLVWALIMVGAIAGWRYFKRLEQPPPAAESTTF